MSKLLARRVVLLHATEKNDKPLLMADLIVQGKPVTIIITPEVHARLKSLQASMQFAKNFEFHTDREFQDADIQSRKEILVADSVEMLDDPEYSARKRTRSAGEAEYIEIGVDAKGNRKVLGIPPDFDFSIADSIKIKMADPKSLKIGTKVNNLALIKIVEEENQKIYVFKPLP